MKINIPILLKNLEQENFDAKPCFSMSNGDIITGSMSVIYTDENQSILSFILETYDNTQKEIDTDNKKNNFDYILLEDAEVLSNDFIKRINSLIINTEQIVSVFLIGSDRSLDSFIP